jgi:hypothetical protein
MNMGMCTWYLNNLLYHPHLHRTYYWKSVSYSGLTSNSMDRKLVQQHVIASVPTVVQLNTSLLTHVPRGSTH